MSRRRSTRQQATGPGRPFQRTDRIGETVRELVAEELERIGDERLGPYTNTGALDAGAHSSAPVQRR